MLFENLQKVLLWHQTEHFLDCLFFKSVHFKFIICINFVAFLFYSLRVLRVFANSKLWSVCYSLVVRTNLWSPSFYLQRFVDYDFVPQRSVCDVVWAHWLIACPVAHRSDASLGVSRLYLRIDSCINSTTDKNTWNKCKCKVAVSNKEKGKCTREMWEAAVAVLSSGSEVFQCCSWNPPVQWF